jgi:hypothetical protein
MPDIPFIVHCKIQADGPVPSHPDEMKTRCHGQISLRIRSLAAASASTTSRGLTCVDVGEIKSIVREVVAEQREDPCAIVDETIIKTVEAILTSFVIDDEGRKEMLADFQYLRRWRKGMDQVQSCTFKAIIALIVTSLVGAVWLGVKAMLGK